MRYFRHGRNKKKGVIMYIKSKEHLLEVVEALGGKLYIVGAGKFGNIIGQWFNQNGVEWEGYIDQKKNGELNGKKLEKEVDDKKEDYFLISSHMFQEELITLLIEQGITEERILIFEENEILYDLYEDISGWKKYVKRNQIFRNVHKEDKRCFIIGNGPSLRLEDLEMLKNEITFACNSIYALYNKTDWRPTYYCAWDPVFCKEMMSTEKDFIRITEGAKAIFTSVVGEGYQFRDNEQLKNVYYTNCVTKEDIMTGLPFFSTDCSKNVYASGTIAYGMLQLAAYMGFEEIYLLGMDCSFSHEVYNNGCVKNKDVLDHMEEIEANEIEFYKWNKVKYGSNIRADMDCIFSGYMKAEEYTSKNGKKIYNATRGGALEIFERVDFDSLF